MSTRRLLVSLCAVGLLCLISSGSALALTVTVNTTGDDNGECTVENCSFREAVNAINDAGDATAANPHVINFDLPGCDACTGPCDACTITFGSELYFPPVLVSNVVIDGFSQDGSEETDDIRDATIKVIVDGEECLVHGDSCENITFGDGEGVRVENVTMKGLSIVNFVVAGNGLFLANCESCVVSDNLFGLYPDGSCGFLEDGIEDHALEQAGTLIENNVISCASGFGIEIGFDAEDATDENRGGVTVRGNYLGMNAEDCDNVGISGEVIRLFSGSDYLIQDNVIGNFGVLTEDDDVPEGEAVNGSGIYVSSDVTDVTVFRNIIGMDATGASICRGPRIQDLFDAGYANARNGLWVGKNTGGFTLSCNAIADVSNGILFFTPPVGTSSVIAGNVFGASAAALPASCAGDDGAAPTARTTIDPSALVRVGSGIGSSAIDYRDADSSGGGEGVDGGTGRFAYNTIAFVGAGQTIQEYALAEMTSAELTDFLEAVEWMSETTGIVISGGEVLDQEGPIEIVGNVITNVIPGYLISGYWMPNTAYQYDEEGYDSNGTGLTLFASADDWPDAPSQGILVGSSLRPVPGIDGSSGYDLALMSYADTLPAICHGSATTDCSSIVNLAQGDLAFAESLCANIIGCSWSGGTCTGGSFTCTDLNPELSDADLGGSVTVAQLCSAIIPGCYPPDGQRCTGTGSFTCSALTPMGEDACGFFENFGLCTWDGSSCSGESEIGCSELTATLAEDPTICTDQAAPLGLSCSIEDVDEPAISVTTDTTNVAALLPTSVADDCATLEAAVPSGSAAQIACAAFVDGYLEAPEATGYDYTVRDDLLTAAGVDYFTEVDSLYIQSFTEPLTLDYHADFSFGLGIGLRMNRVYDVLISDNLIANSGTGVLIEATQHVCMGGPCTALGVTDGLPNTIINNWGYGALLYDETTTAVTIVNNVFDTNGVAAISGFDPTSYLSAVPEGLAASVTSFAEAPTLTSAPYDAYIILDGANDGIQPPTIYEAQTNRIALGAENEGTVDFYLSDGWGVGTTELVDQQAVTAASDLDIDDPLLEGEITLYGIVIESSDPLFPTLGASLNAPAFDVAAAFDVAPAETGNYAVASITNANGSTSMLSTRASVAQSQYSALGSGCSCRVGGNERMPLHWWLLIIPIPLAMWGTRSLVKGRVRVRKKR